MEIEMCLETLFWIPVQHDDTLTVGICNILTTLYYNKKTLTQKFQGELVLL